MPFAELPGSHLSVNLNPPDWGRFAEQANSLIANQPQPNTAAYVEKAVDQIDKILQLSSPEAKMQRRLQMLQLGFMQHVYEDYQAHPEKYQMSAHGPVLIDPVERALKFSQLRKDRAYIDQIDRQGQVPANLRDKVNLLKGLIAGKVPVKKATVQPDSSEVVPGTNTDSLRSMMSDDSDYSLENPGSIQLNPYGNSPDESTGDVQGTGL